MKRFMIGALMLALSSTAYAIDIGEISVNLMTPALVITKFMIFAGYVVGAMMLIGAIVQYRNHLESPKLVPLTTPILLLLLGLALLLVPYFSTRGHSGSAIEQAKRTGQHVQGSFLPTPPEEETIKPGPGRLPPDQIRR